MLLLSLPRARVRARHTPKSTTVRGPLDSGELVVSAAAARRQAIYGNQYNRPSGGFAGGSRSSNNPYGAAAGGSIAGGLWALLPHAFQLGGGGMGDDSDSDGYAELDPNEF